MNGKEIDTAARAYAEKYLASYEGNFSRWQASRADAWTGLWDIVAGMLVKEASAGGGAPRKPMAAEETALALMRRGIPKTAVKATRGHITVTLPNGRYNLYRSDGAGLEAGSFRILSPGQSRCFGTKLPPDALAEVLLAIDGAVPGLVEIMDWLTVETGKVERAVVARWKADELAQKTVARILDDVLPALKIRCRAIVRDGKVHLDLTKILHADIDLPLEEVAAFASDPDGILARLTPVEVREQPVFLSPDEPFPPRNILIRPHR